MPHTVAQVLPEHTLRPGLTGADLLHNPRFNKGTAFTEEERRRLGLDGLLPPRVTTIEDQERRIHDNFRKKPSDLEKYIYLVGLQDRNETLFYRTVIRHIEEMMPIIYTPVVGKACQLYGQIFRRARGMFITKHHRGRVAEVLRNWPQKDVRVIVVTDGERILGLGDLGANGMGIPVGKLSLYTTCAGVHPAQTLPITLDVGTNNPTLLEDPFYLGLKEKRITGAEYDALVDEFVMAVKEVFPRALLQFEDFANHNAFRLLEKYREKTCTFNDDIQGTAAVTLAGIYSALSITKGRLADQTILFHGAGEAAIGIADLIVNAMESEGIAKATAMGKCWFVDSKALVESTRKDLQSHKKPYAHVHAPVADLAAAVKSLRPTVLVGVSGSPRQFTKEIVEDVSRFHQRPVVFALSNPTSQAECTAEEAYVWSKGKAIFASGSPFAPVAYEGRTFVPGQANNAYIFPGVGLGVVMTGARHVTEEMFAAAARTLARLATPADLATGCLFPPLTRIREVSAHIAAAVAEVAYRRDLATVTRPADLLAAAEALQYQPVYRDYV